MPPHHYHRDHSVVPMKEKGKESAIGTWPTPSNSHIIFPGESTRRSSLSQSIFTQPRASSNPRNEKHSSNTWTSSSENPDAPSDGDRKDNRERFFSEYNRLAQGHGLRPLVPEDFSPITGRSNGPPESRQGSWISKMLRQASEQPEQAAIKPGKPHSRHLHGHSDVSLNFVHKPKRDGLKDQDLRALVRLCRKSPLFLPMDYAPFSLTLPTCFRALAQALIQRADTKGIFRVPGSERVINALYEYYCIDSNTDAISSTTRCPTLPTHIRCDTHDIASTFKRLLAGLPGGILGSLSLFDAFVAIHSQLQGDVELHRTKESKLRARLIALAIGTVESQYQRELICAVFGLLCLVGRIAENAPREDESGRPLPTTDLMGYNALSVVFGPLLIGDMIDNYSMKLADPSSGLVLLPVSPPKSRKERHRHRHKHRHKPRQKHRKMDVPSTPSFLSVDKIHIANSITEMLIVHWREVVRQIRSTGSVKVRRNASNPEQYPESTPNNISSSENSSPKNLSLLDHPSPGSTSPSTASLTTSRIKSSSTTSRQDNIPNLRTSHVRKAAPHPLSPTIEEGYPSTDEPGTTYSSKKLNNSVVRDLAQDAYPASSDTYPSRAHENSPTGSVHRPKIDRNESIVDANITIPRTVPSLREQKSETPESSSSLVQKNRTSIIRSLDASPENSSRAEDIAALKATSSLGINIDSLATQITPDNEHDLATPNLKVPQRMTLHHNRVGSSPTDSTGATIMDKTGSHQTQINRKTIIPLEAPPSERLPTPYSRHADGPGNGCFPKSVTEPKLPKRRTSTPKELPYPGCALPIIRLRANPSNESLGNPADQWRSLKASSKASTESLAKLAKERRLKRNSGPTSSRTSRDASIRADSNSTAPGRKQESILHRSEPKEKSTTARPEREDTPQSAPLALAPHMTHSSPDKYSTDTPYKGASQRSTSKPMPGAVKAMAALFDNAAKGSPNTPAPILGGRTRNSLRESNRSYCRDTVRSPTRSSPPQGALASIKSLANLYEHTHQKRPNETLTPERYSPTPKPLNISRTAPYRPTLEDTPSRPLRSTLRSVQMFSSARKEPQSSPDKLVYERDRSQPPRLGTMVPYQEEPPVGHFVRPSSVTSAQSQNVTPAPEHPDSRQTSGSSLLYAQIRSLQRQLDTRNEEIMQLRRQLETQEQIDIGTLCEQLRLAKRECMMWRKRAESAERRVAVFQRFGSKFQTPKDGVDDYDESPKGIASSSCSVCTESREVFNDRLRRGFHANRIAGGADGGVFEDCIHNGCDTRECRLRRGRSRGSVKLWEAAQEVFDLQHGNGI